MLFITAELRRNCFCIHVVHVCICIKLLQGSNTGDVAVSKMYYIHKKQNFVKNRLLLHAKYSALNRMQLQVEKYTLHNSKHCKFLDSANVHFK